MTPQPAKVECNIQNGMFTNEYAVNIHAVTGEVSIFADKHLVKVNGSETTGYLKVQVVDEQNGISTVLLPSEALETGSRWARISKSKLEYINGSQQY